MVASSRTAVRLLVRVDARQPQAAPRLAVGLRTDAGPSATRLGAHASDRTGARTSRISGGTSPAPAPVDLPGTRADRRDLSRRSPRGVRAEPVARPSP